MQYYPRNMTGYAAMPPHAAWPHGAKIAVQIVLNYEEGGENCILHGDAASEGFLSEITGAAPWPGQRHWNMESLYEYGARAGFWRLHRLLKDVPVTVFGVATALARAPEQVAAMQQVGWEIASHGLKWVEHKDMDRETERAQIREAIRLHTEVTGARPRGWYTGRCSMNTVDLAAEEGDLAYIADSYADDLPYWVRAGSKDQLIVPYTMDCNDMRFAIRAGFTDGRQFEGYLKDSFDMLYAEGEAGAPRMLSIGLHCRLAGRPGRAAALRRVLDYFRGHDGVWFATRAEIADTGPPRTRPRRGRARHRWTGRPSWREFGDVFEHSKWIADKAYDLGLGPTHDTATGVHSALARVFRSADDEARLGVLTGSPGPCRKTGIGQAPDGGLDGGAGQRRARRADRRGTRPLHHAQRCLHGKVRLSLHHRGARPRQGLDHGGLRAAPAKRPRHRIRRSLPAGRTHRRPAPGRDAGPMTRVHAQPLTAEAFAPFGDVLEADGAPDALINQGLCGRYHDRARLEFDGGRAGISLFKAELRPLPYRLEMMERHPLGSQAFIPMSDDAFLVIVAQDAVNRPDTPLAFLTRPRQAINFHKNMWHGVLTPITGSGLFAVVDRIGPGDNLQEHWFDTGYEVVAD